MHQWFYTFGHLPIPGIRIGSVDENGMGAETENCCESRGLQEAHRRPLDALGHSG